MRHFQKILMAIFCMFLISGCYEDRSEITLNADGSGAIKQTIVASERLIVAASEDGGNKNRPPISKQQILEKVDAVVNITTIKQTELADGGRMIELEGTFSNPEQFFLSDFCRDTLKLRLAPAGEGKAAIYWDSGQTDNSGPSITQLYGLAKGLYVKRTVHLPAIIDKTNGSTTDDKKSVSWITDLRDKKGLDRTKTFVEGKDKGIGAVVFDASALAFSLPLKVAASAEKNSEIEKVHPSNEGLKAEISWIEVNKKITLGENSKEAEISDLELGINLNWKGSDVPYGCHTPVLTNIQDDAGNDLVKSGFEHTYEIPDWSTEKLLEIKVKSPAGNPRTINNIAGYVPVITTINKEKFLLENIHELVGKESTGHSVLDNLHFKIKEITGPRFVIEIDGGHDTITSLEILDKQGNKVKHSGGSGWENNYTYDFADEISKDDRCELEVIVSKTTVKVPFSLEKIELP